jgi:hypothetical protein
MEPCAGQAKFEKEYLLNRLAILRWSDITLPSCEISLGRELDWVLPFSLLMIPQVGFGSKKIVS